MFVYYAGYVMRRGWQRCNARLASVAVRVDIDVFAPLTSGNGGAVPQMGRGPSSGRAGRANLGGACIASPCTPIELFSVSEETTFYGRSPPNFPRFSDAVFIDRKNGGEGFSES